MTRRYLSLQPTNLAVDRLRLKARRQGAALPEPFALYRPAAHGEVVHAVDRAAAAAGIGPGLRLADARAILPELKLAPAAPAADRRFLDGLASACLRYTPAAAIDQGDGGDENDATLVLDITGCAHLFGGEAALLTDLARRLDRLGLGHRLAIAGNPALAWAWARHGAGGILKGAEADAAIPDLPVRALRLEAATITALERLGLCRIGQLQALPQRALVQRFGRELVLAMARLAGTESVPFTPLREPPRFAAATAWPEPIGRTDDIRAAILALLERLAVELERATAGARRLELLLFRVDGEVARLTVRTGQPSRHAGHLMRLADLQLDGLDIGFGIESLRVEVAEAAPLAPEQTDLAQSQDAAELARLVDQLRQHLGPDAVRRLVPRQSHWPEHAQALLDPAAAPVGPEPWLARQPRPLHLHDRPVRIDAVAPVPDGPPILLRRFGEAAPVRAASGPERLEPEWWQGEAAPPRPRDYYRVVDAQGQALWLYREGRFGDPLPPAWYVHGVFE
jgi:protein ImuB